MLAGIIRAFAVTTIFRLVIRLMMDRRVPLGLKLVIPAALLYILSPIDLLHDFVPILGRIDDIVVALVALAIFLAMAPRHVVSEHLGRPRRGASEGDARRSDGKVIEGSYRIEEDEREPGP